MIMSAGRGGKEIRLAEPVQKILQAVAVDILSANRKESLLLLFQVEFHGQLSRLFAMGIIPHPRLVIKVGV